MAKDRKYGQVTLEHGGHIPDDEPGVWLRGSDPFVPKLLIMYRNLCANGGSTGFHLEQIDGSREIIESWQAHHQSQVHVPTSQSYADRMGHHE